MVANAITLDGEDFTFEELQVLARAKAISIGQKNNPNSSTLDAPALQGPFQGNSNQYGIFSAPGVRPQRFAAIERPFSFLDAVTMVRSEYTQQILEIVTAQLASSGTNATGFCGNPPTVGGLATCAQAYTWGDYYVKTNLEALPLIGQLRSRADVPGQILNQGPQNNPLIPDIMFQMTDTRSALAYELFRIGVDLGRTMEKVAILGTATTQNSTYIGWTTQFAGLDGQIKTGYTDALAPGNPTCPAVDSTVMTFNADIAGTGVGTGVEIVRSLTSLYRGLKTKAMRVGMPETRHVIVMRMELFQPLTEYWACNYSTYACAGTTSAPNMRDGMRIQELRIGMWQGQYLLIDGTQVPVVFSDGLPWDGVSNNKWNSDIYIVPISWNGVPLLTLEYFPLDNPYTTEFAGFAGSNLTRTINNGMYLVGNRNTGLCFEYHFAARFRLILQTPFLAGRLNDVQATYLDNSGNAYPTGESLFAGGGSTFRSPITPGSY